MLGFLTEEVQLFALGRPSDPEAKGLAEATAALNDFVITTEKGGAVFTADEGEHCVSQGMHFLLLYAALATVALTHDRLLFKIRPKLNWPRNRFILCQNI